jgi:AcrR family transcriptional regulator
MRLVSNHVRITDQKTTADMIDKKKRSDGSDGRLSDTRQRIYDAALSLFTKRGYNKVTIDDICNKVGVTKGAFYAHFVSKDQLVMERILAVDHYYRDEILPRIANLRTAGEKLLGFLRLFFAYMNEVGKETVRSAYQVQIGYDKKLSSIIAERRELFRILEEIVSEGQKSGEFRTDMTSTQLTQVLMHGARGIIYNWCLPISRFDIEEYGESLLLILIAGLKKER